MLWTIPVATFVAILAAAFDDGRSVSGGDVLALAAVVLIGFGFALLLDDLFGYEAQIDQPGAPRVTAGGHPLIDSRFRTRHVVVGGAVLAAVGFVLGLGLASGRPGWWLPLGLATAVLSVAPCGPYLRARRRGADEVVVAAAIGLCLPSLVLGALVGEVTLADASLLLGVGFVAGGAALAHTSVNAEWDRTHGWRSLPARLGAARSRQLAATCCAAGGAWVAMATLLDGAPALVVLGGAAATVALGAAVRVGPPSLASIASGAAMCAVAGQVWIGRL